MSTIIPKYTKNKAQKTELGKNFTLNLKYFRNRRGWTQKELADKLGNSQQAIWFWEVGGKSPRLQDLDGICEALNITIIELFGLENEAFEFVEANPLKAPKKHTGLPTHTQPQEHHAEQLNTAEVPVAS